MKVIIGENTYVMNENQCRAVLSLASDQVPFGIYALKKNKVFELRKDVFENEADLNKQIIQYKSQGFNVYFNRGK